MRSHSHFQRDQAVYQCRACKRNTRQTGRGDNDRVSLCAQCFDLGGEENHLSDTGKLYSRPVSVLELIEAVTELGGDALCWDDLKTAAINQRDAA